jgi:hypothetical protein
MADSWQINRTYNRGRTTISLEGLLRIIAVSAHRSGSSPTLFTLKFIERLKASGIPESQAKGIAEAFQEASQEIEVATKMI